MYIYICKKRYTQIRLLRTLLRRVSSEVNVTCCKAVVEQVSKHSGVQPGDLQSGHEAFSGTRGSVLMGAAMVLGNPSGSQIYQLLIDILCFPNGFLGTKVPISRFGVLFFGPRGGFVCFGCRRTLCFTKVFFVHGVPLQALLRCDRSITFCGCLTFWRGDNAPTPVLQGGFLCT